MYNLIVKNYGIETMPETGKVFYGKKFPFWVSLIRISVLGSDG